ncbi:solute:sodium symporter family transporter [Canicola haemoglobinophilus]|uniref:Transporter n=1 Tax=Canicola haemoglobinophilus TaxID=733 RepID=A0A1V4B0Y6_9PAST|nr:solute:sodium symporter family transporter [Canicola haemoglobinophilus]OOS00426.1 solute:sodium symporter family transporter [Canicola haemoglobinophilus]STO55242.1 transporter [Canicola haemoglobinophilus]STO59462.1 transporter [Canicola haemoglobinophilus]STO69188.1 transporter [Canicola haemoglobinophilus]
MFLTIVSFLVVTGLIAGISWYKTRNDDLTTSKGYFLAGRGLSAVVIGCSMVLTSLSTEQLIGVNANSYKGNFSIIAWTVQPVIPLCFLALYLLPKYIRNGYTTIPEFFESRFDRQTRLIMSTLFLVFYLFIVIPTALYTGAIAFNKVFNLETIFGLSYGQAIVYTVIAIGVVGAIYAIFGGLKAVAVSDTWNAVILVIGALLVPIFALSYLGDGSISEGFKIITTTHIEKFNAIGSATDAVPWPAMFTGILIVHFFYWTTNQAIVQRALGAKDLKAGQKGILIAALFLLLLPIILNLPGLLSFHILGEGLKMDVTYPQLVNKVLPTALQGFFVAALFGAVLSTFNSFLNSAATIFCKDLLPSISKKERSDVELIAFAKKISAVMAVVTIIIAPLLMFGTDGIFLVTKRFAGFVNIPIVALFAVGLFNKTVSGLAARIALLVHVVLYFCIVWVFQVKWNFVYVMASLFVFDVVLMLFLGQFLKRATPYEDNKINHANVDLTNWEYAKLTVASLVLGLVTLYTILSPLGLASEQGNTSLILGVWAVLQVIVIFVFGRKQKA